MEEMEDATSLVRNGSGGGGLIMADSEMSAHLGFLVESRCEGEKVIAGEICSG